MTEFKIAVMKMLYEIKTELREKFIELRKKTNEQMQYFIKEIVSIKGTKQKFWSWKLNK